MFGCSISTPRGGYSISTPRGEIRLNILYLSQYCGTEKHERMPYMALSGWRLQPLPFTAILISLSTVPEIIVCKTRDKHYPSRPGQTIIPNFLIFFQVRESPGRKCSESGRLTKTLVLHLSLCEVSGSNRTGHYDVCCQVWGQL